MTFSPRSKAPYESLKAGGPVRSSIATSVFNLTKNILGGGLLSLSYGVALGTGLVDAILCAVLLGMLSAYSFWVIGLVCFTTKEATFKGVGTKAKSAAFGLVLEIVCISKTSFSVLAFSLIIQSVFSDMLASFGIHLPPSVVLMLITATVLLPLCLLKDLSALKPFSILGLLGLLYTLVFMAIRLLDHSYLDGGVYHKDLVKSNQAVPSFAGGIDYFGHGAKSAILVSMLSTAYIAHYNAPRFYNELEGRSPQRFAVVVGCAFGTATLVVCGFMTVGYLTFGSACKSMILDNYSIHDPLATVARAAIGGSIVCTYPLIFSGFRDGLMSLADMPTSSHTPCTVGLLGVVMCVALCGIEIGFVQALGGAIFGALLIYILPGYICIHALSGDKAQRMHVTASAVILLPIGLCLGIVGSLATVFKNRL